MDGGSAVLHRLPPLPKRREGGIWLYDRFAQSNSIGAKRKSYLRREQREPSQNKVRWSMDA